MQDHFEKRNHSAEDSQAPGDQLGRVVSIIQEMEKVVLGKRDSIVLLIIALLSGGHVLIEDVPGVGKTTIAAALAKTTGLAYKRVQFTPDVMASDITGFSMYNKAQDSFEYRPGIVMTNILLADEINRSSPKTQSSLLEVMEERKVTVDGVTYEVPHPFMVVATQNPMGFVGTYPLPEAQLDRFIMKITMGYPDPKHEMRMLADRKTSNPIDGISTICTLEQIESLQRMVADVYVEQSIYQYIVELVGKTRRNPNISLGASPRASLSLMRVSQAYAFLSGRNYVLPEDVSHMYPYVISHRVTLNQQAKINKVSIEEVIAAIKASVNIPYQSHSDVVAKRR